MLYAPFSFRLAKVSALALLATLVPLLYGTSSANSAITTAPTISSVLAGNTYLEIRFTAPSGTPTNYDYSIDDGLTWTTRSPAGTWSPLTIYGLTNGTQYKVRIRARDADGPGPASTMTLGTPADQTQIVGSQAFIQGAHAEVGIRPNGAFGSSSSPSVFHSGGACLGFRADRQANGWGSTVGSSPNYTNGNIDDGDFFCPGSPFEGWALKANGASTSFSDNGGGGPSGSFSTPVTTTSESSVTWTSTTSAYQGLTITQKASVPTKGQLLNVDVTIKNDSASTVNEIYYVRNFDPDNGSYTADMFTTVNTILKSGVDGTGVNIRSTWPNGAAIFLQTNDSRARGAIHTSGLGPSPDPIALYNGTTPWSRSDRTADVGTGISFLLGSLAAGASTTLRVTYNLTESSASSPSVTTSAATNVGVGTTATLNGVVNANGLSSTVSFKYGLNADLSGATTVSASPNVVTGTSNQSVSANIAGLTAGSTYYFQVVSSNSSGTSSGSILSFTPIASATVVNLAVTNLANTSVTLNGSINPGGGSVSSAKFVYSTLPTVDASTTDANLSTSGLNGTNAISVNQGISGLSQGTIYYYYLEATTQSGTVRSNILSFTTTPAPSATTSAATSVNSNSARLNGSVNANNWNTTSVYFTYATNPALTGGTTINTTPSQATGNSPTAVYADVTGLSTGVTYYYRLTAVNVNGSNSGSVLSFTPADKPIVITGTATNSGLRVTFPGVVNANGSATTSINVIYGTTADLSSSTATLSTTPSSATGSTDVGVSASPSGSLLPSTTYYYQVVAVNSFGETKGVIRSITTPAAVVVGPTVTITSSASSVSVSSTFTLTINFSAAVSSFTKSMITASLQSGWALADAVQIGPTTYTVDVIPAIGAAATGSMSFTLAANVTTDTFGNGNQATASATSVTALPAGLVPTFSTPVPTIDGFTVNVTNYNSPTYTETGTVSAGIISFGTPVGSIWPITVSGLASGASATVTVTTTRSGYSNGTASVTGTTILPGRVAIFDTPVRTGTGFTVNQTNYDPTFTQSETVTVGTITRGTILGSVLPLTISGLAPGETSTVTTFIDKTGYLTGTTTVTGQALQSQVINFATLENRTYGDLPFTLVATGGDSLNPVSFSVGTPAVCSTSGTNGNLLTILSSGSCTVRADQAGTSAFSAASRVERTFTINQKLLTITASNIGINYGGTVVPVFSVTGLSYSDTVTAITYTFSGTLSSTPPTGSGSYSITPSAAVFSPTSVSSNYVTSYVPGTLTIVPNSISGLDNSRLTRLGTITASDALDSNFSATAGSSSVIVSVPRGTLPSGSVIEAFDYSDTSTARALLTNAGDFILQAVIAWSAPDGSTPITNTGKSVQVTVTSPEIKTGSRVYAIVGGVAREVGIATVNGTATFNLTEDPVVVLTPTVPDAPTSVTALASGSQTATISWSAPAINGGSDITGYTATSNSGLSCTTSALSCSITGLTNGTSYTFRVFATNIIGNSESSTATSPVVPFAPGLNATYSTPVSTSGGYTVNVTNYDPTFSWNFVPSVGSVLVGTPVGSSLPLTISGLNGNTSAVITTTTSKTGFLNGISTVTGTSLAVYVVDFDATTNGGSAISPAVINFTVGDSPISFTTPAVRSGFTFTGWFTSCSGGSLVNSPYTPTGSITLCAQWSAVTSGGSGGGYSGGSGGGSTSGSNGSGSGGSVTGGVSTPVTFKLIAVNPSDLTKLSSETVCLDVYSSTELKLDTICSDVNSVINLQLSETRFTLRAYSKNSPTQFKEYFGVLSNGAIQIQSGVYFAGSNFYALTYPEIKVDPITPTEPNPSITPEDINLGPYLEFRNLKPGDSTVYNVATGDKVGFVPNSNFEALEAISTSWKIQFAALDNNGKVQLLADGKKLQVIYGGSISLIGFGFLPNSKYRVYQFSNLDTVETGTVDVKGEFKLILPIRSQMPLGDYVIQLNAQNLDKKVISASVGFTLITAPAPVTPTPVTPTPTPTKPTIKKKMSAVIPFAYAKTSIQSKQMQLLQSLALNGKNKWIIVTGYAQKNGKDDFQFSRKRALATKAAILKLAPNAIVKVVSVGSKKAPSCQKFSNRCVIVKIRKV